MKCTDMYEFAKQIRNHSLSELELAIKAHGGSYSWYDEENEEFQDDYPIVMCNHRYAGPVDVNVKKIWIDEYGSLNIEAVTNEFYDDIDIDFGDIAPHHINYIIDHIPETETVKDVTLPFEFKPIAHGNKENN